MPRAVLDPNVLVSAFVSPIGAPAGLVKLLLAGAFELVVSPRLIAELDHVLGRGKFRRYATNAQAAAYVELVQSEALTVADGPPPERPLCDDPNDEYLVVLVRTARATLVSGDRHLLSLRGRIPVSTPRELLATLVEP